MELRAFATKVRAFLIRSQLPVLLLLYPTAAWLLLIFSSKTQSPPSLAGKLVVPLTMSAYAVAVLSLGSLLVGPIWASRYRKGTAHLSRAFRRGLYVCFGLVALIILSQGVLLSLALYVAEPEAMWFSGMSVGGGAALATLVLLRSGLTEKPGIYTSLRALRIDVGDHPQLSKLFHELSTDYGVPLPPHILIGLQPGLLAITTTVFSPDGELDGGVLCISLPATYLLSIPEFSAVLAQALLHLEQSRNERRKDFLSTTEGAGQVIKNLAENLRDWNWARWGLAVFLVWPLVIAMRLALYLGKQYVTLFVNEFWVLRGNLDLLHGIAAHQATSARLGAVPVVSALIKEAALSFGLRLRWSQRNAPHALSEVWLQIQQKHPQLMVSLTDPLTWERPDIAWRHLQFRCSLSGISLDWCRLMALDVSPEPAARSLFQNFGELESELLQVVNSPLLLRRHSAASSGG